MLSFAIFDLIFWKFRFMIKEIGEVKIASDGLEFPSYSRHRLDVSNCKCVFSFHRVGIYSKDKIIFIENILDCFIHENFLYFKGNGTVKIIFDFEDRHYFYLDIKSNMVDINHYKSLALIELVENLFDYMKCENFKKFLKIVKNLLKIRIFNDKIEINQNKFKISYTVRYKINNKIKKVFIN